MAANWRGCDVAFDPIPRRALLRRGVPASALDLPISLGMGRFLVCGRSLGGDRFGDEWLVRRPLFDVRRRSSSFFVNLGEQPGLNRGGCALSLRTIVCETTGLEDHDASCLLAAIRRDYRWYNALNGDLSAVAKILSLWGMLPDHRPLTSVGLITPYPGLLAMQQIGQHRAVGDIGRRRRHRVDQQI